ncbi:hypothetical protein AN958_02973 [Leucoagaricus sp. SymC.cos]|nr:hypothetical protein AN958_02973 [Leucoagaricus sp. SymC.cos]
MGRLPLAESRLCALFVECILFGLYFITYAYTTQALLFSRQRLRQFHDINKPVYIGTTSLFFMVSGNVALNFYRSLRAFIFSRVPDGAELEYRQVSEWFNIVETAFVLFGTLIGDWILLHRCWILWSKMWRWIFLPSLLWIGCLFCAIRIVILEASFIFPGVFNSKNILPYGTSFWAASILINISTTVLTVYRIWLVEEANKQSGLQSLESDEFPKSMIHFVICITVESGLMNTLTAIATFVIYVIQSNAIYIMTAFELPVTGIACNLIILRASRRTKRLLKRRIEESELGEFRTGIPTTIPYSLDRIENSLGSISGIAAGQSHARSRIEELPYP